MEVVLRLAGVYEETGKLIRIGLEPEPDCFLETTKDVIDFFELDLDSTGCKYVCEQNRCAPEEAKRMIRRHLGVCFDTCHLALQFEDLSRSLDKLNQHGIGISKIQISAALSTRASGNKCRKLSRFADSVYLHQVKGRRGRNIASYGDLKDFLKGDETAEEWRVHCHVPLYFEGDGVLGSTSSALTTEFFGNATAAGVQYFEIETYTFEILPNHLRKEDVVTSVVDEYRWVMDRLNPTS